MILCVFAIDFLVSIVIINWINLGLLDTMNHLNKERKMDGLGVMLKNLGGNQESVNAYRSIIGKVVSELTLGDDDALHFVFDDGSKVKVSDEGQSCCEERYMRTDDDLKEFIGAKLIGMELKDAPDVDNDWGTHETQFLEVKTDRGVFTMASHNEHNGYYGGFYVCLSLE